jgi:hypothetical protein
MEPNQRIFYEPLVVETHELRPGDAIVLMNNHEGEVARGPFEWLKGANVPEPTIDDLADMETVVAELRRRVAAQRRLFSPKVHTVAEKRAIIAEVQQRSLVEGRSISRLALEFGIGVSTFYGWVKQLGVTKPRAPR